MKKTKPHKHRSEVEKDQRSMMINYEIVQSLLRQPEVVEIAMTLVQDLALGLVWLHEVHIGPFHKPVNDPLNSVLQLHIWSCHLQNF